MSFFSIFKLSFKSMFNPKAWVDYQTLKDQAKEMASLVETVRAKPVQGEAETFDQALERQGLSIEEADARAAYYLKLAISYTLFGLMIWMYGFVMLFRAHAIITWLLSTLVAGLLFSQAFQFDFWALQIRRRQLGLTFQDWKKHILGEK